MHVVPGAVDILNDPVERGVIVTERLDPVAIDRRELAQPVCKVGQRVIILAKSGRYLCLVEPRLPGNPVQNVRQVRDPLLTLLRILRPTDQPVDEQRDPRQRKKDQQHLWSSCK